jgi:hypothetical protein
MSNIFSNFKKCKEHKPVPTIKMGIAMSQKWCEECKKFIKLKIDYTDHP